MLFVGTKLTDLHQVIARLVRESLMIGPVFILVVGAVRWLMLRSSMRPLTRLAEAVHSIVVGELDQQAPCADRSD